MLYRQYQCVLHLQQPESMLDLETAGNRFVGRLQMYVANAEAANCRRVLVDALGLDLRSSMGHCMQQVVLRMQAQEPKEDASL